MHVTMTCSLRMSMVVGREAPTTPGCLKKLLKTRSMASHGHRKVCVFNLNPNIWFFRKIQIRFCVAAGSAAAATPVQPKLQQSATDNWRSRVFKEAIKDPKHGFPWPPEGMRL